MAVWRVLVLNKWRRFAPPDKHTPHELNSLNYTRKIKARTEGEAAAKPLAVLRLYPSCVTLIFKPCITFIFISLLCAFVLLLRAKLCPYSNLRPNR